MIEYAPGAKTFAAPWAFVGADDESAQGPVLLLQRLGFAMCLGDNAMDIALMKEDFK